MPFVSIGVPTYNRHAMLRETIASILSQDFADFEVIIGNNHLEVPLSPELLGIRDPRVRIVNHPQDIGQRNNMNSLLHAAKGRYYTWLNDDDLYALNFLQEAHAAIVRMNYPLHLLTNYGTFSESSELPSLEPVRWSEYAGPEFLERYLDRRIRAIGCYGLLEREYLIGLGGIANFGEGAPLYADNLLSVQAGLLARVPYTQTKLVFFRIHQSSVSNTSTDLDLFHRMQAGFVAASAKIFLNHSLSRNGKRYTYLLFRWIFDDAVAVASRSKRISIPQIRKYLALAWHFFLLLGPSPYLVKAGLYFVTKTVHLIVNCVVPRRRLTFL